ncbi:MAG: hypothetical protein IJJ84_11315 [Kiritimatiellae bacterium]|nr:hypothetical protein [Kiritimatiellia bacterium]
MNKLVKDFAKLLEDRGLVIEDEDKVSQVPHADYTFAKQIYKSREVLVPLMLKLAICANEKETALYNISYKGGMLIVRQFLQNIVDQFLDNLRKSELISRWCRKDDGQYEILTDLPAAFKSSTSSSRTTLLAGAFFGCGAFSGATSASGTCWGAFASPFFWTSVAIVG